MTNWAARARAEFSESPTHATAKTAKTPISPVSAVSSVGVVSVFENTALAEDLMAAAMRACDFHGDGPMARKQMVADVLATPLHLRDDLRDYLERTYPVRRSGEAL